MNLELEMFVKNVEVFDKERAPYISFGVPINTTLQSGEKSPTVWFNFICVTVAFGKLKERGIRSGDRVKITKAYPKVSESGKLNWIVTDVE